MKYPVSDHFDGTKFYNQNPRARSIRTLWDVLKWKSSGKQRKWPEYKDGHADPKLATNLKANQCGLTFVNHATILVQVAGANIITDPVFSKRVSPLSWAGPKRSTEAGMKISELPKIDFVLISHNHYDHIDIDAIQKIKERFDPVFICPLGNLEFFKSKNIKNVVELDWWQSQKVSDALSFHFAPAQHWSSRSLTDRNKTLWGSFVTQSNDLKIYFAGDTGYYTHFKQIFEKFGVMDISLIPIGAYEPEWFMSDQHMNPKEAAQAHLDLHSRLSIGIHFGCFQLTDEYIDQPEKDLKVALEELKISSKDFLVPQNGESFFYQK